MHLIFITGVFVYFISRGYAIQLALGVSIGIPIGLLSLYLKP